MLMMKKFLLLQLFQLQIIIISIRSDIYFIFINRIALIASVCLYLFDYKPKSNKKSEYFSIL